MTHSVVRITRVLLKEDLRQIHAIRRRVKCKTGEAWVLVNTAGTMAAIVDSARGFHRYWAPKGQLIDTAMLQEMAGALYLNLEFHKGRGKVARLDRVRTERRKAA